MTHRGDQQRAGDRYSPLGTSIFIVERIFPTDERGLERDRQVAASFGGAYQRTEHRRVADVSPAEVIENGNPLWICPYGNRISHRFIDRICGHPVRVEVAVERVNSIGDGQSFPRAEHRIDYRG